MSKPEVIRTAERLSEIEARNLHRGTEHLSPLVVESLCATIRELWRILNDRQQQIHDEFHGGESAGPLGCSQESCREAAAMFVCAYCGGLPPEDEEDSICPKCNSEWRGNIPTPPQAEEGEDT